MFSKKAIFFEQIVDGVLLAAPDNYYPLAGETSRLDAGLNSSALPRALGLNASDSGNAIASPRVLVISSGVVKSLETICLEARPCLKSLQPGSSG